MTRITIVNGHPDPSGGHFVHALVDAYAEGARAAGHELRRVDVATLAFESLHDADEFERGDPPPDVQRAQGDLQWAEHWLLAYPLWLGSMPGRLKTFLEQALRPRFAFEYRSGGLPRKLLAGRSARIVVTMGMPGLFYRLYYRAHSLRSLERNVLGFCGIAPLRTSLVGRVESMGDAGRARWLARLRALGARAA